MRKKYMPQFRMNRPMFIIVNCLILAFMGPPYAKNIALFIIMGINAIDKDLKVIYRRI